ncbi:hypothetical protein BC629DRAFT_1741463 [Irpex lacteus]|nr:hypothetical protein BC629DRAFT_1741463 [Irpex lacteus]
MAVGSSNSNMTNNDDGGYERFNNVVRASLLSLSSPSLFLHNLPSTDLYYEVTERAPRISPQHDATASSVFSCRCNGRLWLARWLVSNARPPAHNYDCDFDETNLSSSPLDYPLDYLPHSTTTAHFSLDAVYPAPDDFAWIPRCNSSLSEVGCDGGDGKGE